MRRDETIANVISNIQKDLQDLKGTQFSGSDNLLIIETSETFHYSIPAGSLLYVTIIFTSDRQANPYAELNYSLSDDSGGFDSYIEVKKLLSNPGSNITTWRRVLTNFSSGSTREVDVTWYVSSTDSGVITQ